MSTPWDTAARLALIGLLAWRLGSVLLRAAGLLYAWAGIIEIATGTSPPAGAGALVLGTLAWLVGQQLHAYCRGAYRSLLAERALHRQGQRQKR